MESSKVLHLLKSNVFSGAENVVVQIINLFKHDRKMYYCSPNGKIRNSLKMRNIKYISLNKFNPIFLYSIVKKYQINIIHAHDPGACVLASFIPLKIIAHIHGNHDNMKILSFKSILFLISSFRFKKIIWVSNSCLNDYYFKKYVENKSIILENVIDSNEIYKKSFNNDLKEVYDCIYLGRLSPEKNPIRAIKIINEVVKKIPNYKVVFVGDGILRADCEQLVKKYNLDENVCFIGFQNNPIKYLKNSNVLIMTSIYEGIPMSALEAMCLGKPIVSTPTDGLINLIQLNKTGFYSSNDNQLIDFMIELYKNNQVYNYLSQNTLKRFKKINNLEKYKKKIEECYEK